MYEKVKNMERYSRSLDTREIQIKLMRRIFYAPISMASIIKLKHNKCWQGLEAIGTLIHYW